MAENRIILKVPSGCQSKYCCSSLFMKNKQELSEKEIRLIESKQIGIFGENEISLEKKKLVYFFLRVVSLIVIFVYIVILSKVYFSYSDLVAITLAFTSTALLSLTYRAVSIICDRFISSRSSTV